MPQLDITTYSSQLFWLVVCFGILYLLLSRVAVPKITAALEKRTSIRDENLNKASAYREEAEELLRDYEEVLAEAREKAQAHYKAITHATTTDIAAQQKDAIDKMNDRLHLVEQNLYRARLDALSEMRGDVDDLASVILAKLTGSLSRKGKGV